MTWLITLILEVERAKNDCKLAVEGKIIKECLTKEDNRVFQGCTHTEFADALRGKRIANVGRLGKYFYSAPHVVMHLGMAGFVQTKGKDPLFYRKKAKNAINEEGTDWPMRYWKFALHMDDGSQWCFCDSRRFGRISLVHAGDKAITEVEPLSLLGRDPYLNMPPLEDFTVDVLRRKAPIKAVLLDQNGPLCGLGNWMVDEIFFQAAMHPAQRANTLSSEQLQTLYDQVQNVTNTAVKVNANHKLFPANWLFKYRWGKGRRNEPATFTLPDGSLATVIHQTIGGRTTAIVETVQKLLGEVPSDEEVENMLIKGEPEEQGSEEEEKAQKPAKRQRRTKAVAVKEEPEVKVEIQPAEAAKPTKLGRPRRIKQEEGVDSQVEQTAKVEGDEQTPAVKISARKRKAPQETATGKQKVKTEVVIETPVSSRPRRASARSAK